MTIRNIISAQTTMKVNGLGVEFNNPSAVKTLIDSDGNEVPQGLPPYKKVVAYPVDEFPACPENWMHGSAKASSFFLPVVEGSGAWLDFNSCNNDEYDVAVVVSVQGVNSVTGQKTTVMRLEQYKEKCPLHDVEFQQDRFCPTCKYKWPAQNYLATTGTPRGHFWLDGFRSADGVIRQYIITADEAKGVAAKKIGKDRVFAVGIAFYRSKEKKPKQTYGHRPRGQSAGGGLMKSSYDALSVGDDTLDYLDSTDSTGPCGIAGPSGIAGYGGATGGGVWNNSMAPAAAYSLSANKGGQHTNKVEREIKTSARIRTVLPESRGVDLPIEKVAAKTFEIGAGARISQEVYADPKELSYWEEEPAGMVYINYTDPASVEKILAAGKREEEDEGFLNDVPVAVDK